MGPGHRAAPGLSAADELRAAANAMSVEADRLDALDREASAGPWRVDERHGRDITDEGWSYYGIHAGSDPRPQEIAEMRWDDPLGGDDGEPRRDADLIVHRRNALARDAVVLRATAELLRDSASNIDCAEADRSPDDTSEITDVHALAVARAFTGGLTVTECRIESTSAPGVHS